MNEQEYPGPADEAKLGFTPNLYCNVAGTVAGGKDRQRVLSMSSSFVTKYLTLTRSNDGIRLGPEQNNVYDPNAIQVWLATSKVQGKFRDHQLAGYLPRRVCYKCWKSFGGPAASATECPYCRASLSHPMTYLNVFLQPLMPLRLGAYDVGALWISQGQVGGSWGCRLAFRLPEGFDVPKS